jgi:hypothetical protein
LSSDWRLYTPGSEAGLPVSVVQNFTAPRGDIGREALADKVESTATALLGLTKINADPVDLDYKALTNAGSWFIGKLRTDRDKAWLLEGLEAEQGTLADRSYLDSVISSLGSQVFLLHDVHRDKPIVFHTRWALSYLAGPLTREQLAQLKARRAAEQPEALAAPEPEVLEAGVCSACQTANPPEARFCMQCGTALPDSAVVVNTSAGATGLAGGLSAALAPAHVAPLLPPGTMQ